MTFTRFDAAQTVFLALFWGIFCRSIPEFSVCTQGARLAFKIATTQIQRLSYTQPPFLRYLSSQRALSKPACRTASQQCQRERARSPLPLTAEQMCARACKASASSPFHSTLRTLILVYDKKNQERRTPNVTFHCAPSLPGRSSQPNADREPESKQMLDSLGGRKGSASAA